MNTHRELIGYDRPTFLWYLFKYYHTMAVQTVRMNLAKINNLRTVINNKRRGNIDRFETYVVTLLLCSIENGVSDDQVFSKVYKVFD